MQGQKFPTMGTKSAIGSVKNVLFDTPRAKVVSIPYKGVEAFGGMRFSKT